MSVLRWVAALVLAAALAPGVAQAKWLRAESPQFIVYSDGGERALRSYISDLEVYDALLKSRHRIEDAGTQRKLTLYLVRTQDELKETAELPDKVGGYYLATMGDVFAAAVRESGDDSAIKHEYAHHFMLQHFAGAYPAWFVEGFAEFYATAVVTDRYIEVGRFNNRIYSVLYGQQIPTAELLGQRPSAFAGDKVFSYYGTAWLLTHYLFSDPERYAKAQAYLDAVADGAPPVQAMEKTLGMSTAELDKTLQTYREHLKYVRYPRAELATQDSAITVTELPPSADLLLLDSVRLKSPRRDADEAAALLARVKANAAKFPGDRLATLTLAQADPTGAGIDQLQAWTSANPKDAEALTLLGSALLRRAAAGGPNRMADLKRADAALGAAVDLAPDDYLSLAYAALALQLEQGKPSALSEQLLLQAFVKAKPVAELRMMLFDTLVARGDTKNAVAVLTPLANNPHGGPAAEAARKRLAGIAEKAGVAAR